MSMISVDSLFFTYPDGSAVLDNLSLTIEKNDRIGLIGVNGAGKSTFLLQLNGFLTPTSGELHVKGLPVNKKNMSTIRQCVGMVFQEPDDQLFMPTVFEDVAFGPVNYGVTGNDLNSTVMSALEEVGVEHLINKPPYSLSGGEKRRVAIASTLALKPEVLILDEPTANLDPRSRRQLIKILKNRGGTQIIATHDLDMCLELCTRIIIISQGTLVADGTTQSILADKKLLEQHGLELPLQLQGCPMCHDVAN